MEEKKWRWKMKTAEQISDWLKKQKWTKKFVHNMRTVGKHSKQTAVRVLHGEFAEMTIAGGFDWNATPQGKDYWYGIHKKFIDWYHG